jgi:hypothetical protein
MGRAGLVTRQMIASISVVVTVALACTACAAADASTSARTGSGRVTVGGTSGTRSTVAPSGCHGYHHERIIGAGAKHVYSCVNVNGIVVFVFKADDIYRWIEPESTRPSVLQIVSRRRLPSGGLRVTTRALKSGHSRFTAQSVPSNPESSPPSFEWRDSVLVSGNS